MRLTLDDIRYAKSQGYNGSYLDLDDELNKLSNDNPPNKKVSTHVLAESPRIDYVDGKRFHDAYIDTRNENIPNREDYLSEKADSIYLSLLARAYKAPDSTFMKEAKKLQNRIPNVNVTSLVMPKEEKYQVRVPDDMLELIEKDPELSHVKKNNTGLTQQEFDEFYKWGIKKHGDVKNLLYEMGTYDVQGAWKSGDVFKTDSRGHGTDKWKKPNHRTSSTESVYHSKETPGGRWLNTPYGSQFHPSKITLDLYGTDQLQKYFQEHEPNVKLMWQSPNTSY